MNLYLLYQSENRGYDTYSDCVAAAESPEDAVKIHPGSYKSDENWYEKDYDSTWTVELHKIDCTLIGEAVADTKRGVICASFHAG